MRRGIALLVALSLVSVAPAFANGENGNGGGNGGGSTHHNVIVLQGGSTTNTTTETTTGDTSFNSSTKTEAAAAPNVSAPALTSGHDTCMGSTSAGIGGQAGLIGGALVVGKTWTDVDCNRRKYAMLLRHFGFEQAAVLLLAQNEEVGRALLVSGAIPNLPVLSKMKFNETIIDREGNPVETAPASLDMDNSYMDHGRVE